MTTGTQTDHVPHTATRPCIDHRDHTTTTTKHIHHWEHTKPTLPHSDHDHIMPH